MVRNISAPRPESEWREIVAKMQASGLTQSAWCRANGINLQSLNHWVCKFRDEQNDAKHPISPAKFLEAGTINPKPHTPTPSTISITFGSFTVSTTGSIDPEALTAVLKAVVLL